ncbi:hypothetical protein LTR91_022736 [Friedmanniomyces endolithicus]|uniref:GST N-terminal domain-containing protein n=1 Tax=Friedmanniomyces endolithicus TaxID=329885 RepID=A0AAN6J021_9PEZI|nr:hypothetical protein LTR35_013464 [Friedmanniomyces endolithicus]KAK0280550.1 hypothetical protein LTS00_012979 [Friedmanniomyces endolithicus]KAK0304490.1 hypothetical protein LTR82_017162 [Friedmanniomyces endolithicus]KAK0307185.1 hypothetical protein LTR01_005831 [Friedmanniomyces endolithicus]KAK0833895.1 hypothetical protein LTR73_001658 [Friedmanniomyces endolithicus]
MVAEADPDIILYDLACTKKICFSPAVWRIRLMLNYKKIPYRTIFVEFPDIESTLKKLGVDPGTNQSGQKHTFYSVPTIQHLPTNTLLMDSSRIGHFLETTYPDPPIPLVSPLGVQVENHSRLVIGSVFRTSIMPREIHILSPRSQEHFRRTREARLGDGQRLEDLLGEGKEERSWEAAEEGMQMIGELLLTNAAEGPFVLGATPSYTDFFVAGSLEAARVVDNGVFERVCGFPGFREVYDGCAAWMERKD